LSKISLLLATTNKGKIKEFKNYLKRLPLEITSLAEFKIGEPFPEEGKTFLENARGKSLYYSQFFNHLTLAEDSGLEIECLEGKPGVLSARFAGSQATDEENIQKVLEAMRGIPLEKRKARFVSCMVISERGEIIKEIQEGVEGLITFEKRGEFGFGYDPIFLYPPLGKTFAELRPEEKNRVSHRGLALKKLKEFLSENYFFSRNF